MSSTTLTQHCAARLNDLCNSPPEGEARIAITLQTEARAKEVASELTKMFGTTCAVYVMEGWGSNTPPKLLTVLPKMCGKGNAAEYVRGKLGFEKDDCLCAGDTKGGETMLTTGFHCVCVRNSTAELLKAREELNQPELHYLANRECAGGVQEGVARWRAKNVSLHKRT